VEAGQSGWALRLKWVPVELDLSVAPHLGHGLALGLRELAETVDVPVDGPVAMIVSGAGERRPIAPAFRVRSSARFDRADIATASD